MSGIEGEIVRLVKEIAKHEVSYVDNKASALDAFSERAKQSYLRQAEEERQAIERKMNIITILKR